MINQQLFAEFLRVYAFQPATAFWRGVEVDVLRKHLPTSGTVLDLGCGDGKLTVILFGEDIPEGVALVGIDSDEDETCQAASHLLYMRVHTCWASNIPEPSMSFDHVISNSVLEHIPAIDATLAEVTRLLKPGGTFTFTVPSPGFHRCLRGPLLPGASREAYLLDLDKRLAHYRYWGVDEWREILERYGLQIEQQVEYLTCAETRRWETISRFTAGILYALNGSRNSPIEVQKKLGLRQVQNRVRLSAWLARLLASALSFGVSTFDSHEFAACLLILARKEGWK
jgi:ubiquinone/menaquinone biosynthesis C-methylase UbiE